MNDATFGFDEFDENKKLADENREVSPVIYPPSKDGDPLSVVLLSDPVNVKPTIAQMENGTTPGRVFYMWEAYLKSEIARRGGSFVNSKGDTISPISTPKLMALHSVDEDGQAVREGLPKEYLNFSNGLYYEPQNDVGAFLKHNPDYWPTHYTSDFKDQWKPKANAVLRVLPFGEDGKLIRKEKLLFLNGGFMTSMINTLKSASDLGISNFNFYKFVFRRNPKSDGKSEAIIIRGDDVTKNPDYEDLIDWEFKYSLTVGDDRILRYDNWENQQIYLADYYGISVPDRQAVLDGKYSK